MILRKTKIMVMELSENARTLLKLINKRPLQLEFLTEIIQSFQHDSGVENGRSAPLLEYLVTEGFIREIYLEEDIFHKPTYQITDAGKLCLTRRTRKPTKTHPQGYQPRLPKAI